MEAPTRYEFTQDWLNTRPETWEQVLEPYVGVPAQLLEIGSFEGRSATWFLDNVLTHPDSRITCIDTFGGSAEHANLDLSDLERRFDRNMASHAPKVTKIKGPSRVVLRDLPLGSFDIAYVDGSHEAEDVLTDAVLVWDLVKPGGVIALDDYGWHTPTVPKDPSVAIDAFMEVMEGRYEVLHKHYMVVLAKR
jgi:predicted O-methyltransferase YrrM